MIDRCRPETDTGSAKNDGGNPAHSGHREGCLLHPDPPSAPSPAAAWDEAPELAPDWDRVAHPELRTSGRLGFPIRCPYPPKRWHRGKCWIGLPGPGQITTSSTVRRPWGSHNLVQVRAA